MLFLQISIFFFNILSLLPFCVLTSEMEVIKCHHLFTMKSLQKAANAQNIGQKFLQIWWLLPILLVLLPLYVLRSEVVVVKCCHGISIKCSRYQDTRPTDPSLVTASKYGRLLAGMCDPPELEFVGEDMLCPGFTHGSDCHRHSTDLRRPPQLFHTTDHWL